MPTRFKWSLISDERLLDTRICDLPIRIKGSSFEPHIKRLYSELNDHGIRFKPHVWLSAEWFTPDGVPGFAIPFYLAHPRLMKLERKQMLEVEGGRETGQPFEWWHVASSFPNLLAAWINQRMK